MTDQGRIPESGLSPYVHMLEAELAKLRDDLRHADEAYARVAAERERLGAERDTLLAALGEAYMGLTVPGYEGNVEEILAAISEVGGGK